MDGKETELDRTIIEAIKDPLTHIVRNAIDHGIETAEARVAAGKPADGQAARCAPSTRAGRSTSRSPTTARASTRRGSAARRSSAGSITRRAGAPHERRELLQPHLPARASRPPRRSPTSPDAASAWTSSRPTSRRSAAPSTCRAGRAGDHAQDQDPATLAIIPALIVTTAASASPSRRSACSSSCGSRANRRAQAIENIHGAPVYRLRGNLLPLVYLNRRARSSPVSRASDGGRSTSSCCRPTTASSASSSTG